MEPAGLSGTVIILDQRLYIEIETSHGKNPIEIHSILMKFVMSSQCTVVQFLVGLIFFMIIV